MEQLLFRNLDPVTVLDLVEDALPVRAEGICRPLTSYINRVYDVQLTDGTGVVVKFYRPGRWSEDALLDEHEFVYELEEADVPVVAPLTNQDDESLFDHEGLFYALYPRRRGRPFEDPDFDSYRELGRTLARMHIVGDQHRPSDRLGWHPEIATKQHVDYILREAELDKQTAARYEAVCAKFIAMVSERFKTEYFTRIHGDCHVANLMRRPDTAGITLIDFDDMAWGPPVQDMWMLLPGTLEQSPSETEAILEGYMSLRPFNREDLSLIEPLRAMRFIHFAAWCIQQQRDGTNNSLDEAFGSPTWWTQEIRSLEKQMSIIELSG